MFSAITLIWPTYCCDIVMIDFTEGTVRRSLEQKTKLISLQAVGLS